jgi:hypothetical protein
MKLLLGTGGVKERVKIRNISSEENVPGLHSAHC